MVLPFWPREPCSLYARDGLLDPGSIASPGSLSQELMIALFRDLLCLEVERLMGIPFHMCFLQFSYDTQGHLAPSARLVPRVPVTEVLIFFENLTLCLPFR